jgi:hypothetical protein
MRRLMTLTALGFVAIGCGGSGSESGQVAAVVKGYFSAYARGDGSGLCPLLTQSAQSKMVEVAESDEQELGRPPTVRACPEAVNFLGPVRLARSATVISVSIAGDNATVIVKLGGLHAGPVTLSRAASGWLIDKLPGET